ncbi:hypothetical protein BCV70DRAFT_218112 [Testicularia cyperi]|uniref:Uncharacterized protein n=1 Tax=Testicularia cyperi TaxID=1882483 RepID=A0A317XLG5_9BASI|nr:hypothetical protein BCV70DRAFT_218112 [Testicularia cyperi]
MRQLELPSIRHDQRDAFSDASLWDDIDDPDHAFATLATPVLTAKLSLPPSSPPIAVVDMPQPQSHPKTLLEEELFPSDKSDSDPPRRTPLAPSSSNVDYDAAERGHPWSQKDAQQTQYMRQLWLESVGMPVESDGEDQTVEEPVAGPSSERGSRATTNLIASSSHIPMGDMRTPTRTNMSNSTSSGFAPVRTGSRLLDQLDEICGSSPSPSVLSAPRSSGSVQEKGPTVLRSSRSSKSMVQEGTQNSLEDEPGWLDDPEAQAELLQIEQGFDQAPPRRPTSSTAEGCAHELSPLDILHMPGSPPDDLMPRITLIKDMPPDKQEFYHRIAFGDSLGSQNRSTQSAVGVTVRGSRGKTWQTTWQQTHEVDHRQNGRLASASTATARADNASRDTPTSSSATRAKATKTMTSKRGRTRTQSSTSTSLSSRSRFFARRGRGAKRGRK